MPNWCENQLTILCFNNETAEAVLDAICERVDLPDGTQELTLTFEKVLPQPEHISDSTTVTDKMPDWWYWRNQNWGTKWDVEKTTYPTVRLRADGKAEIAFVFDTAWSPSLPVSEAIARKFPNTIVAHAYDEAGMDFGGFVVWADGKMAEDENGGSRSTTWAEYADFRVDDVLHDKERGDA
jgi:hypothetical protein